MLKQAPTFEKELLTETVVVKRGRQYPITPEFLANCAAQFVRMKESGLTVNVHSGHNHDPETKRGEVLDIYLKKKKDGRMGLFGKIAFLPHLPKEMIKTLVNNGVSVELPKELYDADGNVYAFPVQRVAITPDPAVRGMQPFVQQRDTLMSVPFLTLSLNNFNKENTMPNEEELFDPQDIQNAETDDEGAEDENQNTSPDESETTTTVRTIKKNETFANSALAKTLFETLGIDPDEYEDDADLQEELSLRLAEVTTFMERAYTVFDVSKDDPNRFDILTRIFTIIMDEAEKYDRNGDGVSTLEEVEETADDTPAVDSRRTETIDGAVSHLEDGQEKLELSISRLQKNNTEQSEVIRKLVAKNRQLELDNMLQSGVINRQTHRKACSNFVLKLSLNDGFDAFIEGAKLNSGNRRDSGQSHTAAQVQHTEDPAKSWTKVAKRLTASYKR